MKGAGSGQDDSGGALVVREAILPIPVRHVTGLQEDSPDQQTSGRHGDQLPSTRHQTSEVGRVLDFWDPQHLTISPAVG